jgi:hypothetical protein
MFAQQLRSGQCMRQREGVCHAGFSSKCPEYFAQPQQILPEWTVPGSCKFASENDLTKQRKNPTENKGFLGVFSVKQR